MLAISIIFTLVVWLSVLPIIRGIDNVIGYKIEKSKISDLAKRKLTICFSILIIVFYVTAVWGFWLLSDLLEKLNFGSYIQVLIYTLILGALSSNSLYLSPKQEINSAWDAFRNGFTKGNVNNFFAHIPLNMLINLFYLVILIVAHVEDLEYCTLPNEVSYFFTLNKYGIVIVLAIQKVIKSVTPDKERAKILTEAFVQQEKEDDAFRDEVKKSFGELKISLKRKRQERKNAKDKRKDKKDKDRQ